VTEQAQRTGPICVLLVEDNPGDVRLTQKAFDKASVRADLYAVDNGKAALDFLHRRGEYEGGPGADLVLLDLKLGDCEGTELLEQIKKDPALEAIPVIVLSSSAAPEDIARAYHHHANAYITKPTDFPSLIQAVHYLNDFWFELALLPPHS
jgi:CheY-like chemotaxis protein